MLVSASHHNRIIHDKITPLLSLVPAIYANFSLKFYHLVICAFSPPKLHAHCILVSLASKHINIYVSFFISSIQIFILRDRRFIHIILYIYIFLSSFLSVSTRYILRKFHRVSAVYSKTKSTLCVVLTHGAEQTAE